MVSRKFIFHSKTIVERDTCARLQMIDIIAAFNRSNMFVSFQDTNLCSTQNNMNALLPGQTSQDKPDIFGRDIYLKPRVLPQAVSNKHLFVTTLSSCSAHGPRKRRILRARYTFLGRYSTQALNSHYNVNLVIIIQISRRRNWTVWENYFWAWNWNNLRAI